MSKEFYLAKGKTVQWPEFPTNFPPPASLTYDDVLLVPGEDTELNSRKEAVLESDFGPWNLRIPLVSAPMDTVSGLEMIAKLDALGGVGTLPRDRDFKNTLDACVKISNAGLKCIYALGLHNPFEEARLLKERGAQMVLLDVAHGGMSEVARSAGEIKSRLGMWIVAGNIATYNQAVNYTKMGIEIARVGVGPGGVCTTRLVTGAGFPQLSAIFETTEAGIMVIADGGVRYPGDAAKALAAGAAMVMLGSMFAGTEETPGEVVNGMKMFRGQASEGYMKDNGVEVDGFRAAEGITTQVVSRGSVSHVIDEITGGIRSSMSYVGARNLAEFRKKAVFTLVSDSTKRESHPSAVERI